MTALADLQARVRRLEQRAKRMPRGPAIPPVPADAAHLRAVLLMLIEAGAFIKPREDSWLWQLREQMKTELGLEDDDFVPVRPDDPLDGTVDASASARPNLDALRRIGA